MKLVDSKEFGYLTTDEPPRGEIWVKGQCVFQGYYKNEALTKQNLTSEGWLKLGDIGTIMPNGSIQIIDRIKNICKTQNGFYVAPVYLENLYSEILAIKQIYVSINPSLEAVRAIITPDIDYVRNIVPISDDNVGLDIPIEKLL